MKTFPMNDFSGGWNARDGWSQVADNESPDMMNMTLDERGGIVKRLGLTKTGAQIVNTDNAQSLFYSSATDRLLAQVGTGLYVSTDGGVTWGASIKTFTTSARIHMVDFVGAVVIIHPVDKCFSYTVGGGITAVITNSPKGTCIAVWSNAMWSVGDSALPSRVTRSDLGALTWPATPVSVDVRAKDDQPLTAVGGGLGMDALGRGGLLVWKEDSRYRLYDAATGAYTVEDYSYGASGPQAVVTNEGVTCGISKRGIVSTSGDGVAGQVISAKIEPLFHPTQITMAQASLMVAGNYRNRMIFSLPWDGSAVNNLTLEYSPAQGWIAPHDFGLTCATTYTKSTNLLLGGKQGTGASSWGYVISVFTGGSDDTAAIAARHQTRWFEPARGNSVRFRRLQPNGFGTFNLYFKVNYDPGQGLLYPLAITGMGAVWGTAVWGTDTWGVALFQDYIPVYSLGHGKSFSIEISESSTLSGTGPSLLDVGSAEARGSFGIYGYALDIQPLGNS